MTAVPDTTRSRTRFMRGAYVAGLGLIVLAGCADRSERVTFDGNYYPAKSRTETQDRREFTASVTRASRGIDGARRAVVHEATRYCLHNFGTSDIVWAANQGESERPVYARAGDRVSVTGRCVIW